MFYVVHAIQNVPGVGVGGFSFVCFTLPFLMLIEKHSWPKWNITFPVPILPLPVGSLAHPEPYPIYDQHFSVYIFSFIHS